MNSLTVFAFLIPTLLQSVLGNCPALSSPPNGNVVVGGQLTGALATYTCNINFYLQGAKVLTCSNMNNWTPEPPTCAEVLCGALEAPANGSVSENGQKAETTHVGTVVTFSCNVGFFLDGPTQITCTNAGHYGLWNGYYPVCQSRAPPMSGYAIAAGSCLGHEDLLASIINDPSQCATRCTNEPTCRAFNIYTAGSGLLTCQPMSYACTPSELKVPEDKTRYFYTKVTAKVN